MTDSEWDNVKSNSVQHRLSSKIFLWYMTDQLITDDRYRAQICTPKYDLNT